jgi:hypothetical protein
MRGRGRGRIKREDGVLSQRLSPVFQMRGRPSYYLCDIVDFGLVLLYNIHTS